VSHEVKHLDGIAYRESLPEDDAGRPPALLLHGFPESSYMWRDVMQAIAAAGRRAIAPDLPGFGDSPPDLPGTWERQVEAVESFCESLDLEQVALVVHDWGGLIGLRWACDHSERTSALVISATGFFPDGRWHGMAEALRTQGTGEEIVANLSREAFGVVVRQASPAFDDEAVDEYFKCCSDHERRSGVLDLYRSGDFEKLLPYDGQLTELGVPALILWGEADEFAPVGGAHRFHGQLPGSRLVVLEDAGHFVIEDQPGRCAEEITEFLAEADG
jgi:haloalkane dehalogenase